MATAKQLQKSAAKTAAVLNKQALPASGWQQLQRSCVQLGITLSLVVMGCTLPAQSIENADKRPQTSTTPHKIELRGMTYTDYTMKDGTVLPVLVSPNGKFYVERPNGRKYYPKSLNKAQK